MGPEIDERELIHAFERHGRVVSYKLLRGSMCGFIDFERIEDAASARSGLHEAKFADCEIRVEYKVPSELLSEVLGRSRTAMEPRLLYVHLSGYLPESKGIRLGFLRVLPHGLLFFQRRSRLLKARFMFNL